MRKRTSVYTFIICSISFLATDLHAQVRLTARDSLKGPIKEIPPEKVVILWTDYNCLPCFKILYNALIKDHQDEFVLLRVVKTDADTSWALHLKDIYLHPSVKIYFDYGDSARYISTPAVFVPSGNRYQVYTYKDIFRETALRKSFIKAIRRRK